MRSHEEGAGRRQARAELFSAPDRSTALLLRPWLEADAAALRAAIDEDLAYLGPWMNWSRAEPLSLADTRARLRGHADELRTGSAFRYAIVPAERSSTILGGASLHCRVGPRAHDVGYWARGSALRRGIASSAVSALVVYAFAERRVERLLIRCDVANVKSAALARALGFQLIGPVAESYLDGSPRPMLHFELLRESYDLRHEPALRERARRIRLLNPAAAD